MGLGDHPGPGRGCLVQEVEQVARRLSGHQAERQRHLGVGRQCLHATEGPLALLGVGRGHPGIGTLEHAAAQLAHDTDQLDHLVPGRQSGCDGPVVGRLVMLAARRGKADGAGPDGSAS